ncbi:Protein kinase domain-containing protein ppk32 [Neolecta irregularis DAH-3]|uniref:Protein kinase domain-containing protein ppk32 n=1 Tax=Neolecta irregularis (strain DAH-3) TaxID=1198029 RepID=A0A1U7LNM7_NEOID|nr:Protein kinase domain-containing protein ppk32 [Neolecta irregularis DAH-3]|eukprot:OLL24193.1 Protein kinase domain-containing protein ppk32 [Neolecta irregularis DAH-3]
MFTSVTSALKLGSALLRSYDLHHNESFSAGPWKIIPATKRAQKYSIFILEKRSLEAQIFKPSHKTLESIYITCKRDASQLAKLRHPNILHLVEPFQESRSEIIFVTEYVNASLSSSGTDLDQLEIQKGLVQICTALEFLHDSVNAVHSNLSPESIFINSKGDWKLGGLAFSLVLNDENFESFSYDSRLPKTVQRNLDYLAPEYVLEHNVSPALDMFSMGCLVEYISSGKNVLLTNGNINTFRTLVQHLDSIQFSPGQYNGILKQLITKHPSTRLSASALKESLSATGQFDQVRLQTITFLENFPMKSQSEKTSFLRGLPKILPQFSKRVQDDKILPGLLETLHDHSLLPSLIPNIFAIASQQSQQSFSKHVLPHLCVIFTVKEPPGSLTALLDNLQILQSKTTSNEFKDDVMKMVYTALEAPHFVQEKALQSIPSICPSLDFLTIKSALFPKCAAVFSTTTMLAIKIVALQCFRGLVEFLDKFTLTEKMIPLLKGIKTREPGVMIAALDVLEKLGEKVEKETVALEVLPLLWSMSLGPLLNLSQFQRFMDVIKHLSGNIESEHSKKLGEMGNVDTSQSSVSINDPVSDFKNLVLGKNDSSPDLAPYRITSSGWTPILTGNEQWGNTPGCTALSARQTGWKPSSNSQLGSSVPLQSFNPSFYIPTLPPPGSFIRRSQSNVEDDGSLI